MVSKLSDSIFLLKSFVTKEWADNIVQYADLVCKQKATVLGEKKHIKDTKVRDVLTYGFSENVEQDMVYLNYLVDVISKALEEYMKFFTYINPRMRMDSANLLKYEVGNYYKTHIDVHTSVNRIVSVIINLNQDYEGGGIVFYENKTRVPYTKCVLKTGDLLMFPSTFLYPHSVQPITKGNRYSIVAWLN